MTFEVVSREQQFSGAVFSVVSDAVTMPGGETAVRDWVIHPGAVGVVVVDSDERVLLVHQYRHPVGRELWELPAGLLDVDGEAAVLTAARELAEEVDLRATQYDVLLDLLTTPGASNEAIRIYLARGLSPVPDGDRHVRTGEEATMSSRWFALDEAVDLVLAGEIENAAAAAGVLAAAAARARGWQGLRGTDAPWRARPDRM
ncbi:NUDIX domain-containing protein [Cryptosporangium aurantiacum]|uniref:ADP-ribose pyrophosphatase n=1 Tax=Cryptosporangium aurantiacum TaxID=134849 RepID=A0A1M7RNT0_9ACTN|nr:NUDIX hydrolase [Cryptosporangium aurantiacum]SHN47861.1 ADP-ribose pyrophosphatase [Cryptosporangium aurantiacum]